VEFSHRLATFDDLPALAELMDAAIGELQRPFLAPEEIAASRAIMGLDSQLIADGTFFVVTAGAALAGCGGWSRRATLYGGSALAGRDARHLDAATEPARVRAMYTSPAFARQGVGRRILALCQEAALAEGFSRMSLMATLAGAPLYHACGFVELEHLSDDRGGRPVPLIRMEKAIARIHG
jgi:GNAT superfamily N-acetyltransferase